MSYVSGEKGSDHGEYEEKYVIPHVLDSTTTLCLQPLKPHIISDIEMQVNTFTGRERENAGGRGVRRWGTEVNDTFLWPVVLLLLLLCV